jgi:CBS domain-containing protein
VVTADGGDYAASHPNLIDSRPSTVGTPRIVSMAKLVPTRSRCKTFLRRNVRAGFREADATERRTDLIVVLSARSLRAETESGSSEMTVETILATKGTDVPTIEPNATVEYGIGILTERGIGALVVLGADHQVIGLLSERDIVRALAKRGASVLTEPLARVMTRTKSTCTLSEPVDSIMEQMTAGKSRHVPVVENERLVGNRVDRRRGQAPAH